MDIERINRLARGAAYCDRRDWHRGAEWWVGELSYRLGIVDGHGMIDIDGPVAREFKRAYHRVMREG